MSRVRTLVEHTDVWLGRRTVRLLLATLLIVAFVVIGLVRIHPYVDTMTAENAGLDDWYQYKLNAISILDGGVHIPRVAGPYFIPGGFLYNHFVAAVFLIGGPNSTYVYVVQFACLALCAVLLSVLARRWMSATLATAYLFVTAAFLLVTFWWWAAQLLSENLTIVLYSVALLLLDRAVERQSMGGYGAAGFLAGMVVLTRPNLIAWPLLLAFLAFWSGGSLRRRAAAFVMFGIAAAAATMILPIRNLYVAGEWVTSGYAELIPGLPARELAIVIGKRALFCIGVMIGGWEMSGSHIVVNKSWLLVSFSAFLSVGFLIARRRLCPIDIACVLTVIAAYGPFLVLPMIGGYGFRFQHPYGPLLLFLVFRAAHELLFRRAVPAAETA